MTTLSNPARSAYFRNVLTVVILAVSLSACAQAGPKTTLGAATGAAAGGLIGAAAGGGRSGRGCRGRRRSTFCTSRRRAGAPSSP